ncbi:MAG: HDIG domain-containing protein [Deltaproteobacteria bacterium]|nr:HDIG domain-containing protein [Deltaproteobacteria bacterium]
MQRWLLLIVASLFIAAFLSQTLEEVPPLYRLGDVAQKDLRTDRDLLVRDKGATEKKMEDAAHKVLPVYDYEPSILPEIEGIIDSAFSVLRRRSAEKTQKGEVEHILGFELTPREFLVLKAYRFNEKLIKLAEDLIAPLMQQGIVSDKELLLQEEGIVVRNTQTGEEVTRRDLSSLIDYREAKEAIKKTLEGHEAQHIPADLRGAMVKIINNLLSPNFTFNRQETDRRREVERTLVKPVFFSIEKGEILLRKGERVTEEALLKLEALREERRRGGTLVMVIGFFLLTGFFVASFYIFSTQNIRKISPTNKDILFLILVLISSLGMARISVAVAEGLAGAFPGDPLSSYYYFFPVAAGAMLIRVVLNSEVALVYSIFASLLTGLLLGEGIFLPLFYLIGSIVGAHSVARCDQRTQLIKGGLLVGLANFLLISFQGMSTGRIFAVDILFGLLMGLAGGAVAGIIVVGITPVVESIFGYTTDIKLLELANLDQPILKEMLMKVPGTYHHSMIVGNLAETGARAIAVNPLLARVSAYYHDIGKITKPQYFIENQTTGNNRHDKLTPSMSSLILVSHVKDGIELAKEHKLGSKIINIIRQHHGTRIINFFYQKAKEQEDPGVQEVEEKDFRYLGPKPQTKEAGLVMLADAVEASSRTLDDPTPARIQGLVQKIINDIFIDGQLDECELTLKDLNAIAKSFNIVLNAIHHQRIEYPETQPEGERQKNGGSSPKSTKEAKGRVGKNQENGRKDIKRLGV